MANEKKMTTCAHCGAEIAQGVKTCPQCGGKNKKPIYKRGWFLALIIVAAVGLFAGMGGDSEETAGGQTEPDVPEEENVVEIVYTPYSVSELLNDLDQNALAAAEKYDEQYVELTGKLQVIDSSGSYISIEDPSDPYTFVNVQCFLKTEEQKQAVMDFSVDDLLVVKGKITDVGEIMGYMLDVSELRRAE